MDTWRDFYQNDPETQAANSAKLAGVELTKLQASRILGGEAASWAESVDGGNFEERMWPRSMAVAERLWFVFSNFILIFHVDIYIQLFP